MKKIKNNFIFFGAVHQDYVFELKNDLIKYRTNPIKHKESYGGVAHNVARTISIHENVSLLSPYIRHRIITEEEVIAKAMNKFPLPKIEKYIQEVFWRTYWKGWLELRPKVWTDYQELVNKNDIFNLYLMPKFKILIFKWHFYRLAIFFDYY